MHSNILVLIHSACLDDTGVDQFHHLLLNSRRRSHVMLENSRVGLGLLQDALHDRIAHDGRYFWVSHSAFESLFIRFLATLTIQSLLNLAIPLSDLLAICSLLVVRSSFVQCSCSLRVVAHTEQHHSFANVSSDKGGVNLNSLVGILKGLRQGCKLVVRRCSVGVCASVVRQSLDSLRVELYRLCEFTALYSQSVRCFCVSNTPTHLECSISFFT